jgi:hypothetical protein
MPAALLAFVLSGAVGAEEPTMAQLHAYFFAGIPASQQTPPPPGWSMGPSKKQASKKSRNRVYTAGALLTKWGEPASRTIGQPGFMMGTSRGSESETWTWNCSDGTVTVQFRVMGYGNAEDPKTEKLQITAPPTRVASRGNTPRPTRQPAAEAKTEPDHPATPALLQNSDPSSGSGENR